MNAKCKMQNAECKMEVFASQIFSHIYYDIVAFGDTFILHFSF